MVQKLIAKNPLIRRPMQEQVGRCVNANLLKGAEDIAQGNVIGELACKHNSGNLLQYYEVKTIRNCNCKLYYVVL